MRYGLAMFGMHDAFARNPEAFLSRMARAGYRYLEPCLNNPAIPILQNFTWTEAEWDSYTPLLEAYGFSTPSLHVFPTDLPGSLADYIRPGSRRIMTSISGI